MGLFGNKKKKSSAPPSSSATIRSFPEAHATPGIQSESELRQRALILLNDQDGIIETEPKAKMKMDAYLRGDVHEFRSFEDPEVRAKNYFTGYHNGKNHICLCTDLNEINRDRISKIATKLVFFPTDSTPHFVGKVAIDDGTLGPSGMIDPYCMDINFNMAYLDMRIAIYELIVYPECCLNMIDISEEGKSDEFGYFRIDFKNSFAVRSNFLREGEAYINSLSEYSIFSQESDSAAALYVRCFDNIGNATDPEAKACFEKRMSFDPRPISVSDWISFSI